MVERAQALLPEMTRVKQRNRRQFGVVGALLFGLLLAACSSDATSTATPTPDPETVYINGLTGPAEAASQAVERANDLLGPIFPRFAPDEIQARVLFNGLREVRFSQTMVEMLSALETLTPPERFVKDHATYLDHLREQVITAEAIDEAIENMDLPHVHLKLAEFSANFHSTRAVVSAEFCGYMTPELPDDAPIFGVTSQGARFFCSDESLPGGEYGVTINLLAKTFQAEFGPRANFPPGMTQEELLQGLTYVQPAIVDVFERTLAELEAIDAPSDFEDGHQVLYDYFDELLSTARAIDRAVADGDHDRVMREFERSGQIARAADDRLPALYRPLVKVIFGETRGQD